MWEHFSHWNFLLLQKFTFGRGLSNRILARTTIAILACLALLTIWTWPNELDPEEFLKLLRVLLTSKSYEVGGVNESIDFLEASNQPFIVLQLSFHEYV